MDVKAKNSLFKKEFLYFYFDGIAGDWRLSRLKHEKLQQWDSFKTTLVDLPSSNYEVLTNLFKIIGKPMPWGLNNRERHMSSAIENCQCRLGIGMKKVFSTEEKVKSITSCH